MITGKSECGIQYAVKRGRGSAGYCSLSIKCGTRDEKGYSAGIAHFIEHTLFKGTIKKKASTINSYLDRLGGELNAYTTKEEIVLHATVLKEDLNKASDLLFELATCATFPAPEIETEKSVVIDEINSYKDSPAEDIYDEFEEMLFKGHPLSSPILGSVSSVKKIRQNELLKFTEEKFNPWKMAFTVVADIDEKTLEKRILKTIGKWFPSVKYQTCTCTEMPEKRLPDIQIFDKTVNKKNHQVNCIIGGLAPSLYEEKERLTTILLCNILGGPASNSILNASLREKYGWVYGVECSYTQYSDTGIVAICLGCDKENLEKCIKMIEKEISKLQESPLSERKLKAAKKQIFGQLAISSDSGEAQCLSMGKSLLAYGKIMSESESREKIESITAEELQNIAKKVFCKDRLSKLTFL